MVSFGLSPAQARAATAHERHVLVDAGAGSGKTRTVVGRILWLLGVPVDGKTLPAPVDLSRIAAITFTNRAAADIKVKLREALRGADRPAEAYAVDTARVGTIHAFCGDVLREFALRRDRNPVPAVMEEQEARALTAEVAQDAIVEALDTDAVPALELLFERSSPSDVRKMLVTLLGDGDRLRAIARNRAGHEPHERALIELASFALTRLERRLDELGAVDFDRMITWTRDLLRDDDYARATLRRRIHTLIVDEFQDVDPVQREIAYLLGDPASGDPGATRLMLVGDAKQSIYRFRRADVSVWREVEREFRAGWGEVIPLSANYRSTGPILDFVEATVGRRLDRPLHGATLQDFEVPFAPLEVGKTEKVEGAPVELIVVPTDETGKDFTVEPLRAVEAAAVARRARELHDEGTPWGAMAVLLSGWGAADTYRAALEREGAPTYVIRPSGFYQRQEVLDVLLALEAIHDPHDERAVFGFLRGPFVALEDQTLLAVARDLGGPPRWPLLLAGDRPHVTDAEERDRLERGVALLGECLALRDRVPVDGLIRHLLDASGCLAQYALLGDEGARAAGNVRKLLRIARGMRRDGLGEFLRAMTRLTAEDEDTGEAPLHGQQDDVVTISTIHSAKGLEWPVVFWCDTVRAPRGEAGDPLLARDRLVLKDPGVKAEEQPERWKLLKAAIDREQAAEHRRLWYVVTTRAMDRLVVSGLPLGRWDKARDGKAGSTPADFLWQVLPDFDVADGGSFVYGADGGRQHAGVVHVADPAVALLEEPEDYPEPLPVGDPAALDGPLPPVPLVPGSPRHSASEMLAFVRCPTRHRFRYVLGLREPEVDRSGEDFMSAVARGNIVHDVLQRCREEDELDALLEDAIRRLDENAPLAETPEGGRYRAHLKEEIALVAGHADYRAVADLPGARRELPFLHVAGAGHFYQGAIDLAARGDAGYVLLDVKTAQGDAEQAKQKAAHYAPQRDVYVRAAEAIGGGTVERFAFQFSRAGVQVSEAVTDELRAEIAASLAERLERMGAAEPALTDHPWECRWCGYRKVGWCEGAG